MKNEFPMIRLEVERMAFKIKAALMEYNNDINELICNEVDSLFKDDNFINIIRRQISDEVSCAIQEEIRNHFRYGDGRGAIRKSVIDFMSPGEEKNDKKTD